VQQEPCLFNNTIYNNVEFGLIGTEWENADIEIKKRLVKQACIEAFADEFISRLPDVSGILEAPVPRLVLTSTTRDTRLWSVMLASSLAAGNGSAWP